MSAAAFDTARRGFLRQLCALPLIGGGVTLIGQPTAVAAPVTEHLLDVYDGWLLLERRILHFERYGLERAAKGIGGFKPTPEAMDYHLPSMERHHTRPPWMDRPMPSTRASLVLASVGCTVDLVRS